ncbi:MAG: FAD-dependent monooxygenase, partial [Bradyrhizobiaceae bacterium]|nr:FAD-dependent monooxygenase [Bradyrhizobiaceae bacterium]
AVLESADEPRALVMFDALSGRDVTRIPTGPPLRSRFGHPYIVIHRVDLHEALLDACRRDPLVTLVPDAMVTRFDDHGDGVTVATEDGRTFCGPALIAADGVRSRIRTQLLDDGNLALNGYVAFRTIVPIGDVTAQVERDIVALWCGPGFHIVHYPLRHGTLFNVVAVLRRGADAERGDAQAYRAELERTHRHSHPALKALLAMFDFSRRQAIGDRDPIRRWHRGRVVLLGDSAHPTLQSLAQGACMAIEDGQCVADCIATAGNDYEAAFRRFESARVVRTARVTLESRHLWELYHADGIAREVYWQMLGERSEADIHRCLAWLYDGFALSSQNGQAKSRATRPHEQGSQFPAHRLDGEQGAHPRHDAGAGVTEG